MNKLMQFTFIIWSIALVSTIKAIRAGSNGSDKIEEIDYLEE